MARGRDKFKKYKLFILFLVKFYSIFPKKILNMLFIYHRKTNGKIGLVIRYAILKNLAFYIGENVSIKSDIYLYNVDKLSIGNNVSIHSMSYIDATGGITIGNDVSIAHSTTIMSTSHGHGNLRVNIKDQELEAFPVIIYDNVWVGSKVTILAGVSIFSGSIIGAGAVVTKDIEENTIAVGVPAKAIKIRKE